MRLMYLSARLGQEPRQTASPGRQAAGPRYLPGQTRVTDDDDVTETELQRGPQALATQPRCHTRTHTGTCTQRECSFFFFFAIPITG